MINVTINQNLKKHLMPIYKVSIVEKGKIMINIENKFAMCVDSRPRKYSI